MKRFAHIAALALPGLLGLGLAGCLVGHHGHVSWVVPPVPLAVAVALNPGHVWVDGHWDWVDGRWGWSEGYWMQGRPGFVWEQGVWISARDSYAWRPGRWQPAPRLEVRDHR